MSRLLARYAEALFWLARYFERAENLARIIDVNETFSRDSRGITEWRSILLINGDEERFHDAYPVAVPRHVTKFYLLDQDNPTSVMAAITMARENARTLRPLISTEMYSQLNVFHGWLKTLTTNDIASADLPRTCQMIKEACQTHTGITEGTLYRDEGWNFYELGRNIERADQTSRLLDIKYHSLEGAQRGEQAPVAASQWNAVLRSAAGYHAFRRVFPRGMTPRNVAAFLLFNTCSPRSVSACVHWVQGNLHTLYSQYGLSGGSVALEKLDELSAELSQHDIDMVVRDGLHAYVDWLQRRLVDLTDDISHAFFGGRYDSGPSEEDRPGDGTKTQRHNTQRDNTQRQKTQRQWQSA